METQTTAMDTVFNASCITPGTKFMDDLMKYIDWYIRKKISEDADWKNIEVIFSPDKVPGEGEHGLISYIRHSDPSETYCINAMDADLIMLSLGTQYPNFYILRDNMYEAGVDYNCINIGASYGHLANIMRWESKDFEFDEKTVINDFIFLCYLVGNDFLPHIPSIEIIENGIELMIQVYKNVCAEYGHLTCTKNDKTQFVKQTLGVFFSHIGDHEKEMYESKLCRKASYFPDPLLEKSSTLLANGEYNVDILDYRKNYCKHHFPNIPMEKVCHDYLEGLQWVLSYYLEGVPHWKWYLPYHYGPPASELALHMDTFEFTKYGKSIPFTPFQQLLSVLPPKSAHLIPEPLCNLLTDKESPLIKFCPDNIKIDLAGKRQEWEGITILPMVDIKTVRRVYHENIAKVKKSDMRRDVLGKCISYKYSQESSCFWSPFGNIMNCNIDTTYVEL